jgi:alpha-glucoside transport system substrate-binding protein
MSRTIRFSAVLVAAAALAAAGCGSSGGTPVPAGAASPGSGLPDLTGQHLEVISEWSSGEQAAFQAVLAGFTRQTHATVTYTSGGNNLNVLLNSRLAGGAPPDIALIPQPGVVAQYAAKGQIKPLPAAVAGTVRANFTDSWQKLGTNQGQLYGFFFKVANKSVVWYRTEAFSQAGVQPPATWDDFVKVSQTLSDSGVAPIAIPAGDGWPVTDWFENIYLRVAGPAKYDELTRHQIPWTDPTVVKALTVLGDYVRTPGTVEKGATQLSFTQSVADVFGPTPKAAMLYEGDFVAGEIAKSGTAKVGTGAKFFPFPSVDGSPPAVVSGGDEAVLFKDSPAAEALMSYLASAPAAGIWAAKGGFLSANRQLDPGRYPDEVSRQLGAAVATSSSVVFDMSDQTPQAFGGQAGADEWTILTDFIGDPGDPAGTAARLEAAAVRDYGSK